MRINSYHFNVPDVKTLWFKMTLTGTLLGTAQFDKSGGPGEIRTHDRFHAMEARSLELMPNRPVVQAWRVETWPSRVYSIVGFELTAQGSGTRTVFDHTGFAPEDREHLSEGWPRMYWDPLRKYLEA